MQHRQAARHLIVVLIVLIGYLLDREIYFYEGVHLGPRVQAWLYDRWSRKYDDGKRERQLRDDEMLAQPLLDATKDVPTPFVLDFATGTGRLSYALTSRPEFKGRIVALDLSQGMLEQAAMKLFHASTTPTVLLSAENTRVEFLRHLALPLPFPDAAFDVVCALEVLELFPNMDEPLAECLACPSPRRRLSHITRHGGIGAQSLGQERAGIHCSVGEEWIREGAGHKVVEVVRPCAGCEDGQFGPGKETRIGKRIEVSRLRTNSMGEKNKLPALQELRQGIDRDQRGDHFGVSGNDGEVLLFTRR